MPHWQSAGPYLLFWTYGSRFLNLKKYGQYYGPFAIGMINFEVAYEMRGTGVESSGDNEQHRRNIDVINVNDVRALFRYHILFCIGRICTKFYIFCQVVNHNIVSILND